MKKILSGLIAAFLLVAGLVAVSGAAAEASDGVAARACSNNKYTPCPATTTTVKGAATVKVKKTQKVTITVKAASNVKPVGTMTVNFKGPGLNKTLKLSYKGKAITATSPKLSKKGSYTVTATFAPSNNFKASKGTFKFKVK